MKFILPLLLLSLILGGIGLARSTSNREVSLSAESMRQMEYARDESQASRDYDAFSEKLSSMSSMEQQELNKSALRSLKQEFKSYADLSSVNF